MITYTKSAMSRLREVEEWIKRENDETFAFSWHDALESLESIAGNVRIGAKEGYLCFQWRSSKGERGSIIFLGARRLGERHYGYDIGWRFVSDDGRERE